MHRVLCEAASKTNITVQKRDSSKRGSTEKGGRRRQRERERQSEGKREREQKSLMYDVANCLK